MASENFASDDVSSPIREPQDSGEGVPMLSTDSTALTVNPTNEIVPSEQETRKETYNNSQSEEGGKNNVGNEFVCRWTNCDSSSFGSLSSLVIHLNTTHLAQIAHLSPNMPIRYTCHWEGCSRYGIEQPSRFALISHCRTHTGEKPYFCPIPECEKHFTRSDALAKHVKGVHDLHLVRDVISLIKERVKKGKMSFTISDVDDLDEYEYISLVEHDMLLRTPWWYSQGFLDTLSSTDSSINALYDLPLNSKQYKLANDRYHAYLESSSDDSNGSAPKGEESFTPMLSDRSETGRSSKETQFSKDDLDLDTNDISHLQSTYRKFMVRCNTANRINKIVRDELVRKVHEKRKLWLINQILLDANISLGLPNEIRPPNTEKKAFLDDVDREILSEGIFDR